MFNLFLARIRNIVKNMKIPTSNTKLLKIIYLIAFVCVNSWFAVVAYFVVFNAQEGSIKSVIFVSLIILYINIRLYFSYIRGTRSVNSIIQYNIQKTSFKKYLFVIITCFIVVMFAVFLLFAKNMTFVGSVIIIVVGCAFIYFHKKFLGTITGQISP